MAKLTYEDGQERCIFFSTHVMNNVPAQAFNWWSQSQKSWLRGTPLTRLSVPLGGAAAPGLDFLRALCSAYDEHIGLGRTRDHEQSRLTKVFLVPRLDDADMFACAVRKVNSMIVKFSQKQRA